MATSLVQRQEEVDKILMREPRSLDQEGIVGQEERQVAMYSGMAQRLCCSGPWQETHARQRGSISEVEY